MPAFADRLPLWTWWLPLVLLHLGSWLSLPIRQAEAPALWYLPLGLGLVLFGWWGWRVLPALALNAAFSGLLWGLDSGQALHQGLLQTLAIGLVGLLLPRRYFDPALPELAHLLGFMLLGVLPATLLLHLGWPAPAVALEARLGLWLLDCLGTLVLSVTLLSCLTPGLRQRGWALANPSLRPKRLSPLGLVPLVRQLPPWWLLVVVSVGLPWLVDGQPLLIGLPLIGLTLLALALGWGFPGALCAGVLALLWVLGLPLVQGLPGVDGTDWLAPQRLALHVGVLLMLAVVLLVGRSLSDLRRALVLSKAAQRQLTLAKRALEASPLGFTLADARQPDLPLIYCNSAFEHLTGYNREQVLGRNCRFLQGEDRQQDGLEALRTGLQRGEPCQVVLRNYRRDGTLFWNEISLAPIRDDQGISHFVGLQHDVTLRQQLSDELAARSQELQRLTHLLSETESIADIGGWVLTVADDSLFLSEGCYRLFELDSAEGPPDHERVLGLLQDESRLLAQRTFSHLLRQGGSFDLELDMQGARGTPRTVRLRGLLEYEGDLPVRIYGALQDITARKRAEQQLRERDDWLRLFFDAPLIGMAMLSPQQQWLEVNYKLCRMLGRSRDALRAASWRTLTHPEDLEREAPLFAAVVAGTRESFELEKRFLRPDGSALSTRINLRAVRDAQGRLEAFLVLIEDISARQEAEARYRTLVEHAPEAIVLFNHEEGLLDANENAQRLFKLERVELLGRQPLSLTPDSQPDGRVSAPLWQAQVEAVLAGQTPVFEWLLQDSAGQPLPCEVRLVRLPGEQLLIRGSITDISERLRYQSEIERLAFSDELTGLPNRRLLLDRLQQAMARERREGRYGALLFIDLDRFKVVNDSLGHPTGDALLREVSRRLGGCLRAQDTLARIGGDEFVVLLEALAETPDLAAEHAGEVGDKLLASLVPSCRIDEHELSIGASIGITLHPFGNQDAAQVLKQADIAMYRAKQGGRNDLYFFVPAMQDSIDQHMSLQSELRRAIGLDQLVLHFQPQRTLIGGRVTGVEALLRWSHPERGELKPRQFLSVAEETGLICELGHWVLEQACGAFAPWHERWPQLVLTINLSTREARHPDLQARIEACLLRHGLPAPILELDICEAVLMEDDESCRASLLALQALGVRLALDDFGHGYCSLSGLQRIPLDRLKIAPGYTQNLEGNGPVLLETLLMIGHNLGLPCVGEGIETQAQLDFLRQHGCALGQGFHLGRPLAEADMLTWLEAHAL
ncbi:MAG: EAL domain-containing protein [Pseudomonadota bacterium]